MYLQFQQLNFSAGLTLGALLGGLIGAVFAGFISILRDLCENKRKRHNNQIQAHSNLLGCKHVLLQYLKSYFLADIAARSSPTYATLTAIKLIDFKKAKHFLECGINALVIG